MPIENHGLARVAIVVSPLRGYRKQMANLQSRAFSPCSGAPNNLAAPLETVQAFQITELGILALRIDLPHNTQALCVAEVACEREVPVHPIFEACIVEVPKRPAA